MSKILVTLVSQQTIPNVLFIKERTDCSKYVFITTEKMEKEGKRQTICNCAAQVTPENLYYIEVIEDSIKDIKRKLEIFTQEQTEDEDIFIVNITGGTKVMCIAAYDFFKDHKSEIYYIPFGKNVIKQIFPDIKNRDFPLKYRLILEEYLRANGIIDKKSSDEMLYNISLANNIFSLYVDGRIKNYFSLMKNLKERTRNKPNWYKKHRKKPVTEFQGLDGFINDIDHKVHEIEKNDIDYYRGGWFEEYIYYYCSRIINKDMIHFSYEIDLGSHVNNEIDVIFVHENSLYIIEAKTNLRSEFKSNIVNEVIYKSAALRRNFGLSCKSFLFHLDKEIESTPQYENHLQRAELLGLRIYGLDSLKPDNISKTIRGLL